ncbi:Arc family DNA-binding protein [Acinetobacter calcoaceticus]|uniref:Arc family DNA-binding protein n=1 Tax=Acinetobacter calcoaceticus TaxID=471 RepID=UPI001D0E69BA|nr:Arc family DNA-binding protein [Acinetobacter calcoaceticus]
MGYLNNVPILGLLVNPQNGVIINFIFNPFAMTVDDNKVVTMKVRVTPEFREKLVSTAKENNRSMNAEIVDRLEKSFSIDLGDLTPEEFDTFLIRTEKVTKLQSEKIDEQQKTINELINSLKKSNDQMEQLIEIIKNYQKKS